jgi:hypothetical protein
MICDLYDHARKPGHYFDPQTVYHLYRKMQLLSIGLNHCRFITMMMIMCLCVCVCVCVWEVGEGGIEDVSQFSPGATG